MAILPAQRRLPAPYIAEFRRTAHFKELVAEVRKSHHPPAGYAELEMAGPKLPLRAISVFEAVARLGSFKSAAREMHLTPSAVSHQIRALEQELGLALFARGRGGVALAPAAIRYADRLHSLLDDIRSATADIAAAGRQQDARGTVRIMTPPSLATHWLMPRLPAFIETYPGIDIRVFAVRTRDGNADEFDITIGYGDLFRSNRPARPLLRESYRPYCAPSRLHGAATIEASQLLAEPLIRSRDNVLSWEAWFARHGIGFEPSVVQHLQVDPSYVAIEAAVKGVGVILEGSILTEEHVQAGRLIAPVVEQDHPAVSYWLLPLRNGARPPTQIAYDWLLSQGNCAV